MSVSEMLGQSSSAPVCLFVGQVPKTMTEHSLRDVLQEFGTIDSLTIIKDHMTGMSKGCAFVTYHDPASASAAEASLHGQRTLPGANNPLQVSPARQKDTSKGVRGGPGRRYEHQEQRKLFIGMVSKTTTDEQLRAMFEPFGRIEDCIILRNADQSSKGCAFVSYSTMEECQKAILALNNSQVMAGCSAPLAVRFADTATQKEERQRKRIQTMVMGQGPGALMPASNTPVPMLGGNTSVMGVQQPVAQAGAGLVGGIQNALAPTMQQLVQQQQQLQAQQQAINQALQMLGLNYPVPGMGQGDAPHSSGVGNFFPNSSVAAGGPPGGNSGGGFSSMPSGSSQPPAYGASGPGSGISGPGGVPTGGPSVGAASTMGGPGGYSYPGASMHSQPGSSNALVGNKSGPEGANLFIYHLPETITDHDLIQMFAHYGNILSAKVFTDKTTGMSKGFGFVSYDNPSSAQSAIQSMNGFQVGPRRIKVQLKKSKAEHRPY